MRLNYTCDEDFPGQFSLWRANCRRSLRSKAGQAALKRLEAALVSMPVKSLIRGKVVAHDGGVCAIGALARVEGKLPEPEPNDYDDDCDDTDDTTEFAEATLGFPRLVAWSVVCENDISNNVVMELAHGPLNRWDAVYRGPDGKGHGLAYVRPMTGEERYARVLAWVRRQLGSGNPPVSEASGSVPSEAP